MGRHYTKPNGAVLPCECMGCGGMRGKVRVDESTHTDTYTCPDCGFEAIHSPANADIPIRVVKPGMCCPVRAGEYLPL